MVILEGVFRTGGAGTVALNEDAISYVEPGQTDLDGKEFCFVHLRDGFRGGVGGGRGGGHPLRVFMPFDEIRRRIDAAQTRTARAVVKRLDNIAEQVQALADQMASPDK